MKKRIVLNENYRRSLLLATVLGLLLGALPSCSENDEPKPQEETNEDQTPVYLEEEELEFDYLTIQNSASIVSENIRYYDDGSSPLSLKLFYPEQSADDNKPLIMLAPGGGWKKYNRVAELEALSKNLAARGYAVAVVNYTINQQDGETWLKSLHDFKVAIKYFKKYSQDFGIDKEKIFTGGWSTGAQLAMYAQHLSEEEYKSFDQQLLHSILDPEIQRYGFEPTLYSEYTAKVRGNILMMPFAWKEEFFDNEGPTLMIANQNSKFDDGTIIWGDSIVVGGLRHIGPDKMKEQFVDLGYVDKADLEMIITDSSLDPVNNISMGHINYTPLDPSHFDAIAAFFHRNL